ncbi:MAG: hypothetical protein ACTHKH_16945 [Trinickia sp.]
MKDQERHGKSRQPNATKKSVEAQRRAASKRHGAIERQASCDEQRPSLVTLADGEREALSDLLTAAISNLAAARTLLNRRTLQVKESE